MSINPLQATTVVGSRADLAEVAVRRSAASSPQPSAQAASPLDNMPQARQLQVNASFGDANLIIYRILDKKTGDLILQIPPEQLLQIVQSVRDLLQSDTTQSTLDVRS